MNPTELMVQAEWLQTVAERLLRRSWSVDARLRMAEWLRKDGRNRVARFVVLDAPDTCPATVIVKGAVGDDTSPFDPDVDAERSPAWRFYNEWASTRFLTALAGQPPFCAKPFAGDRSQGVLVLEDLGERVHLSDLMAGSDADSLEGGLMAYARVLGRMQSATAGHKASLAATRVKLSGREGAEEKSGSKWLSDNVGRIFQVLELMELPATESARNECREIASMLDEPGPFEAFSSVDMCPENMVFMEDGTARVLDFEFAGYHHALLDASFLMMPWPTCAAAWRMPEPLTNRLLDAYREEAGTALAVVLDDGSFWRGLTACCGYWALRTVSWTVAAALDVDSAWGSASVRQRNIQRLSRFAAIAVQHRAFPALADLSWSMASRLRTRWPDTGDLPMLRAFR